MRLFKLNPSKYQIIKISDIASDVGVVCFASLVLPALFSDFNLLGILFGLSSTLCFFTFSLILRK